MDESQKYYIIRGARSKRPHIEIYMKCPEKANLETERRSVVAYDWRWDWGGNENGYKGSFCGCQKHPKIGYGDVTQLCKIYQKVFSFTLKTVSK